MANLSIRTDLDMFAFANSAFSGVFGTATATKLRIDIDSTDHIDLIGSGFTYDANGTPTGGTVKSMTSVVDDAVQFTMSQLSVGVLSVAAAIDAHDANAFLSLLFSGNDRISGKDGDDVLYGFGGTDAITGGLGADTLYGGDGNDKFYMQDGGNADTATGGTGNDTYYIDGADSVVEADGEGTDTAYIVGSFTLADGVALENLNAYGAAAVVIEGNSARNNIKGERGNDELSGFGDRDTISGRSGADTIYGGDDYDRLFGEAGNDVIYGDEGTDRIDGGTGNDLLFGGTDGDRDTFIFTIGDSSFGRDRIFDFEDGIDRLQINGYASLAAAQADGATIGEDVDGNALIKFLGPISTITLIGIDQAQVTAADFVFAA